MPCLPYPSSVYRHQHWHSMAVLKPNEARHMSTWTKRFIESCWKNTTEQQKFSPHYLLFLSFLMILEKDIGWIISIKRSTAHTNHSHLGAWIRTSYSMSTEYCDIRLYTSTTKPRDCWQTHGINSVICLCLYLITEPSDSVCQLFQCGEGQSTSETIYVSHPCNFRQWIMNM